MTLWFGTFTTLLAVINPLEAIPVFLQLTDGQSKEVHRQTARRSCIYAAILLFFFLLFGNLVLRVFGIPLSMVRMVGGIILMRIGFEMFSPSPAGGILPAREDGSTGRDADIAFVPMAMPIMVGPGAIATVLGMASLVKHPKSGWKPSPPSSWPSWRRLGSRISRWRMPGKWSAGSAPRESTPPPASSGSSWRAWGWD